MKHQLIKQLYGCIAAINFLIKQRDICACQITEMSRDTVVALNTELLLSTSKFGPWTSLAPWAS